VESGAVPLTIQNTLVDRAQADQMKKQKTLLKEAFQKQLMVRKVKVS
jgi:hypothetical protein